MKRLPAARQTSQTAAVKLTKCLMKKETRIATNLFFPVSLEILRKIPCVLILI